MKSKTSLSFQARSLNRRSPEALSITGSALDPHHPPRGVLPQRHVVVPKPELRLHQPRRIGHQPGGHFHERAADVQRIGVVLLLRLRFSQSVTIRCDRSAISAMVWPKTAGSGILKLGSLGLTGSLIRRILCAGCCLRLPVRRQTGRVQLMAFLGNGGQPRGAGAYRLSRSHGWRGLTGVVFAGGDDRRRRLLRRAIIRARKPGGTRRSAARSMSNGRRRRATRTRSRTSRPCRRGPRRSIPPDGTGPPPA